MHHSKAFIWLTALFLCVFLSASALAEGALADLWNSGCGLLFHTDNVTVDGEATFSLDGERFKTAKLHYVQDGYNSYYGLTLLTPWPDGTERESGWIITTDRANYPYENAEYSNYYVMEVRQPGLYRAGVGLANDTLLRRSVQLDALVDLGGQLVMQMASMLPEGAVTAQEADSGKTVRIALTEDQIPPVAASALSLAAGYLSDRWFSQGYDRGVDAEGYIPFDSYITVTQALTYGTQRWTLRQVDAEFTLDAQGRVTAAKGTVQAASTFLKDASVRVVEVQFDLTATDYGASRVEPFDPDAYGVVQAWEMYDGGEAVFGPEDEISLTEEEWEMWMDRAIQMLEAQGYSISDVADRGGWIFGDEIDISITNPGGESFYCAFAVDGGLLYLELMSNGRGEETDVEGIDEEILTAAETLVYAFAAEQSPWLEERLDDLKAVSLLTDGEGNQYLTFDSANTGTFFLVQVEPSLRVELFYTRAYDGDHEALSLPGL